MRWSLSINHRRTEPSTLPMPNVAHARPQYLRPSNLLLHTGDGLIRSVPSRNTKSPTRFRVLSRVIRCDLPGADFRGASPGRTRSPRRAFLVQVAVTDTSTVRIKYS